MEDFVVGIARLFADKTLVGSWFGVPLSTGIRLISSFIGSPLAYFQVHFTRSSFPQEISDYCDTAILGLLPAQKVIGFLVRILL